MPRFSETSSSRLATCHQDLQILFQHVITCVDCTILEGHRGREAQEEAFRTGRSRAHFGQSLHNASPSLAVDVAPWRQTVPHVDWQNHEAFRAFGGYVLGVAAELGIRVRWGGDWDRDWDFHDQHLIDLPHFELLAASGSSHVRESLEPAHG